MKKFIVSLLAVSVALAVFASAFALSISAEDVSADEASKAVSAVDNFDVSNAPVSRDFLFNQLEEFKKQLLAEIGEGGVSTGGSGYHDVTLTEGQMILLGADCEVIFRGGSASAITSSCNQGDGITDVSAETELFSGEALEFSHIYYPSGSDAKKAILVTSSNAYFTLKGTYDIV